MKPTFTVLLPVHRPPELLPYAVESVIAQERQDFELFIVCDGAPQTTVECAHAAGQRDSRIRVHAHPKGERLGEAYKHEALQQSEGIFVCEIADDDLWFPNHLGEMEKLLRDAEFGNVLVVEVNPDDTLRVRLDDLATVETRARMATERYNFFGPTGAGYRASAYRRLPVGWAPAPLDVPTDLHMWRKFLAVRDMVCATRVAFTSLRFPTPDRRDWPLEKRRAEMEVWANRIKDAGYRDRIAQEFLRTMMKAEINRRRERARLRRAKAQQMKT